MAALNAFHGFDTYTEVYKEVNGHQIKVDILLPEGLAKGCHPVLAYLHPGALIYGSRNCAPFFQPWLHSMAQGSSAIMVSPDYRLLPEANGRELVADLEDFWDWLKKDLQSVLAKRFNGEHTIDLDRIILSGGSAGGFCCAHLALRHAGEIKAMMLQYPLVQTMSELALAGTDGAPIMGVSANPKEDIQAALQQMKPGSYATDGSSPERRDFGFAGVAWGYLAEWIGLEEEMNPMQCVTEGANLPPRLWLVQGSEDSIIKINESKDFVARVRKFCPDTEVLAHYFEGREHSFDVASIPEPEFDEGMTWIRGAWTG